LVIILEEFAIVIAFSYFVKVIVIIMVALVIETAESHSCFEEFDY
jgi:hypothetical protein